MNVINHLVESNRRYEADRLVWSFFFVRTFEACSVNSPPFHRLRKKDKQDRATVEQVLDPRTRIIIFKMLSRGFIAEVNGCISTGKEANVYHATPGHHYEASKDIAIKIYKTSILTFKDRDRYVTGEFRYTND